MEFWEEVGSFLGLMWFVLGSCGAILLHNERGEERTRCIIVATASFLLVASITYYHAVYEMGFTLKTFRAIIEEADKEYKSNHCELCHH